MAEVLILWLILATGLAGLHAVALLVDPIANTIVKWSSGVRPSNSKAMLALSEDENSKVVARSSVVSGLGFVLMPLLHIGAAILLAIVVSPKFAVAALSTLSLIWGVNLFFTQKLAEPWERIGVRLPVLRATAFVCLLSTVAAAGAVLAWYWAFIPVIIWFGSGFLSAEIAIHRVLRGQRDSGLQCDREMAIGIINMHQGRLLSIARYPYPIAVFRRN